MAKQLEDALNKGEGQVFKTLKKTINDKKNQLECIEEEEEKKKKAKVKNLNLIMIEMLNDFENSYKQYHQVPPSVIKTLLLIDELYSVDNDQDLELKLKTQEFKDKRSKAIAEVDTVKDGLNYVKAALKFLASLLLGVVVAPIILLYGIAYTSIIAGLTGGFGPALALLLAVTIAITVSVLVLAWKFANESIGQFLRTNNTNNTNNETTNKFKFFALPADNDALLPLSNQIHRSDL